VSLAPQNLNFVLSVLKKKQSILLPGLPDGFFSNQKSQFGYILEGLAMEDVGIFYGHLVNFTDLCHILLPFGICSLVLVHFTHFGML
jgi:hypothetical protein